MSCSAGKWKVYGVGTASEPGWYGTVWYFVWYGLLSRVRARIVINGKIDPIYFGGTVPRLSIEIDWYISA